jgi:hypothetical protein
MTGVSGKLNNLISKGSDQSGTILMILIVFMVIILILYAYVTLRKKEFNCEVLAKNKVLSSMYSVSNPSADAYNLMLKNCHIKTAYNCCCTGDFRNDYVDYCGLVNCAKQGFRALDFQIFALNGLPVVSESTSTNNNYKEMYNSLPFNDVLMNIKRYFIQDVINCPNTKDPLFLIFRFKTNTLSVFDSVAKSINTLFGNGNSLGNMIYVPEAPATLDNAQINKLLGKIIIMVDITGLTNFESSKLNPITGVKLGTVNNQIYRESDVVTNMLNDSTFKDKFKEYVNVIYPDISPSSENYDFVTTGINNGIQFIAMNAQSKDTYLTTYNEKYFNKYAFLKKAGTLSTVTTMTSIYPDSSIVQSDLPNAT